ncbi:hypothetical protein WJ96_05625 [Burkholderia ubonensis]|uniref:Uncharacterized protein n=2 Tax=Burkholderia ubonensis TaxID=101571 RepID=A0AAW3MT13_9BURK|nr:hypothetical protein WJ93_07420 [Burkholderia ubonensis]KVP96707.1 hypothetical protein WJ97_12560 [Burkholderia ubonensis]KVP98049.1 hypothetical protein WJ96_05625 [Burkholderia ubonensis]KVZ92746.1 hypothetical protein WL25_17285 [Burkholderia ubonensis]
MKSEGSRGITFVAHGDCLTRSITDTDIERLRKAVEDELRFQHDKASGLQWEDWLEVQVREPVGSRRSTTEKGIEVLVTPIKRAIDPSTGKALTLNLNNLVTEFPTPKLAGEVDPDAEANDGLGSFIQGRTQESSFSYVPATAENVAALANIFQRIDELRLALSNFLAQDQVEHSLLKLTAHNLLPDVAGATT